MASKKTSTGLDRNTAAALSYVLGPLSGILFLVLENDKYIRFHAMQSIVFSIAIVVINTALVFTFILAIFVPLLWILWFVIWLVVMYKAWQGDEWEIPMIGSLARQLLGK